MYTNHCIHHTIADVLDEHQFEARDIMAQTGHKWEASIRNYRSKIPTKKHRQMSACLANQMGIEHAPKNDKNKQLNEEPPAKKTPASTVSVPLPSENIDWLEIYAETADFPDDKLLNILENREKENAQLIPKNNANVAENSTLPSSTQNNISVSNVSNIQWASSFPGMYFPHSNVTINYNINNYSK